MPTFYPYQLDKNITLKNLEARDAKEFYMFLQRNKAHLTRFDPFADTFPTIADTRKDLSMIDELYRKGQRLSCGIWENDKIIGYLTGIIDPKQKSIEIGFGIGQDHQGQGIITRTAQAILSYAFSDCDIEYAWLTTWIGNTASIKVAEKLGFKREAKTLPPKPESGILQEQYKYILTRP